jgi:nucleoside-diphosphate-sugar epimerase
MLLARGHEVSVLTRRAEELPRLEFLGARGILGDLLEPEAFLSSLSPHDVVVSVAMPLEFGRMSKKKLAVIRDRTSKFVSTALAVGQKLECPAIMTLGTSYRTGPGEVADETWPIERFGITEVGEDAENLIKSAVEDGRPIIQMIPGQIYGPGGQFLEMYRRLKSGRFGIFGKGENHIPRIHVEDCAEAFVLAIEALPVGESFIIADDTPCTMREFTEFMAECNKMSRPRTIPRFIARLVLGKPLLETVDMDCIVTNEKAKRMLGWELKYPSYREGLVAAIREIEAATSSD